MDEYSLINVKGIAGKNFDSFNSLVNHQGGPNANILKNSIVPDGNGNYEAKIITGSNYSGPLADSLSLSGYVSQVEMPVGVSGANADYENNLM